MIVPGNVNGIFERLANLLFLDNGLFENQNLYLLMDFRHSHVVSVWLQKNLMTCLQFSSEVKKFFLKPVQEE